jgi:DNA-directed RNA polymerase specialized sigma24 family protein
MTPGRVSEGSYRQAFRIGFGKTVRLLVSRGASPDRAEDAAQAAWLEAGSACINFAMKQWS